MPIYPMMAFNIPRAILDEVHKLQRGFIRGDTDEALRRLASVNILQKILVIHPPDVANGEDAHLWPEGMALWLKCVDSNDREVFFNSNLEQYWPAYWATACYRLWMWHNKTMNDYAVAIVAHNIVNVTNRESVFICRNPPPVGWAKLNTDGVSKSIGTVGWSLCKQI
ncbi:hypothetical protein A2U01_0015909 [Trifolium medium]|uniref:Uncharacterized protein n=1 Tax=Trifolium medium TaxID=97028 RepID=A0A392N7G3_9FABA|nr:hypothetical protein [Trifolium medium]